MRTLFIVFLVACNLSSAEDLYDGFSAHKKLLRDTKTEQAGSVTIISSTDKAIEASKKIFEQVSFLFMTKDEVYEILGDPKSISDYGIPFDANSSSTIIYKFFTGFDGLEYHLELANDSVRSVSVSTLD
jgi:hypothetical protein